MFVSNDTPLVLFVSLAGCSHFRHRFPMTMPCKLVDNHTAPVRFYDVGISAGFPSPAQDYEEPRLHLNDLLIKNPDTTYLAKASGDSMIGAGINDGDTLVVDRGLTNYKDKVVIACVNGEFTVKRYKIERGRAVLKPQNPNYSDIHFTEYDEITVWGVVTSVIHPV